MPAPLTAPPTTLAQDQATAANQGKPGYDILGNPVGTPSPTVSGVASNFNPNFATQGVTVEPTTISSDKSATISANTQKTNDINAGIVANQNQQKAATMTGGFQYYGDGVTPMSAPTDAIQQSDENGNTWYTSGGKNYAIGPDTGLSPEQQSTKDMLDKLQTQSDTYFSGAIAAIKNQYDALIAQQKQINAGAEASTNTALIASGASRYDPVTASGFNQAQMSYGLQKLSDLTAKEMSAISDLNKAQMDQDYKLASDKIAEINKIRDNKQAAAKKLSDDLIAANKTIQENIRTRNDAIDTSIRTLMADAAKGGGMKADQKTALQTALTNHDYSGAIAAVGDTLSNSTNPDIARYQFAKKNGYKGDIIQFNQDWNQAKSTGVTNGKNVTNTVDSSFGMVSIPQNINGQNNQLAFQNNNPGNLRFVGQKGATQGMGGFAKFDTPVAGYNALIADITSKITNSPNSTLQDMMNSYAPASDNNNPIAYADFIAKNIGVTTDTKLSQLDPSKVAEQIAQYESGTTIGAGWNVNDATAPPEGSAGNVPYGITGRTPNAIWQNAITLALDKSATAQKFLGGLSGSAGAGKALKDAISNKSAALITAAGVDQATLQQQFAANSGAINKQVDYMNSVDRNLSNADDGVKQVLSLYAGKGINAYDSTYANTKLNDLSKAFTDSGDLRAYQAALTEIGNEYSQVFSRGGQRNEKTDTRAQDIINGNVTLGDLQKITDELQSQGKIVVQGSLNQIASISSGGGTDQVVKFLSYIHNGSDSTTQDVIQNQNTHNGINLPGSSSSNVYEGITLPN